MYSNTTVARWLIKNYYQWHGEQVRSIRRISVLRNKGTSMQYWDEAYLCRLSNNISTLCIIAYDANNKAYATEIDSAIDNDTKEEMVNRWKED